MAIIIDRRRATPDRTISSRERYLRRIRGVMKQRVNDAIKDQDIQDIGKKGVDVKIPWDKLMREPNIRRDGSGTWDLVLPGNDQFVPGDVIHIDRSGGGDGNDAGEGDEFSVHLSAEEFLDLFFDGMELPDLVKQDLSKVEETKRTNAGFQTEGTPSRLHIVRSYINGFTRQLVLRGVIEEELDDEALTEEERKEIKERIEEVPLFEDMDLRFRASKIETIPSTHATIIMVMDISGSMGDDEKSVAKRFFWLLYHFVRRNYDNVDIVFISHTDTAYVVDQNEFFNSTHSGGTLVSPALKIALDYANKLKGKSNVYLAQASDGDNMPYDDGESARTMNEILNLINYAFYVEIDLANDWESGTLGMFSSRSPSESSLLQTYKKYVKSKNFTYGMVQGIADVYPLFRKFFTKRSK